MVSDFLKNGQYIGLGKDPRAYVNQPDNELATLCKKLEHFETPQWAADEILNHEILTNDVIDPCVGTGVLAESAKKRGHAITAIDIHDWGYRSHREDFLKLNWIMPPVNNFTVFMNPPFSLADKFVEKSFELGARKILCFQRFAWWESGGRREWWDKFTPQRIYICGNRASCWRHDIPQEERGRGTPTAHAWFVWEKGQPSGPLVGRIYNPKK